MHFFLRLDKAMYRKKKKIKNYLFVGAHTLGITHCLNIPQRLYEPQGGKIKGMEPSFGIFLRWNCRKMTMTSNSSIVPNDPTAFVFDNLYYHNVMEGRGVLRIDAEMVMDPRTKQTVWRFAADKGAFFGAFSSAFVKLSSSGVLIGNKGVIRKKCNVLRVSFVFVKIIVTLYFVLA